MIAPKQVVSIHPYFKIQPGKMDEAKVFLRQMAERTSGETGNLYYDFTISGDTIFCREAYAGAEALLKHVESVGPILSDYLKIAEMFRVEVHGAAEELDKLKGPLAGFAPQWFVFECGVER